MDLMLWPHLISHQHLELSLQVAAVHFAVLDQPSPPWRFAAPMVALRSARELDKRASAGGKESVPKRGILHVFGAQNGQEDSHELVIRKLRLWLWQQQQSL